MNDIRNSIGWADYSWNPITGCSPVSEGCAHCYAAAINRRFGLPWGTPVFHPDRLGEISRPKLSKRIFVCSMSDLGHPGVKESWLGEIARYMRVNGQHKYMVLTKRPGDWMRIFGAVGAWLGVTAENQRRADERIPELLKIPAAKHFVSVEPILGAVNLEYYLGYCAGSCEFDYLLGWVIAGPETGPGKRRCDPDWIKSLALQSHGAAVPFWDKSEGAEYRERPI